MEDRRPPPAVLERCPFCGNHDRMQMVVVYPVPGRDVGCWHCMACEADGPLADIPEDGGRAAIDAAWNLRSSPSPWADGIEQAAAVADQVAVEETVLADHYGSDEHFSAEQRDTCRDRASAAKFIAGAIRALVPSPPSAWRDIGEAPKTREWKLLFGDGSGFMSCAYVGCWMDDDPVNAGWYCQPQGNRYPTRPTHWMPLPFSPPNEPVPNPLPSWEARDQ